MKPDCSKHRNIQLQILKDIYTNVGIAPCLGFKGGTAAALFYGLPRDSVDLDFDLLCKEKEIEIIETVKKIISSYGKVIETGVKRFNLLYVISYEPGAPKIKVEVNRRQFGSSYELKNFLSISMLAMTKEDMFANKMMAAYERIGKTSRDIYDLWFFLENHWPINEEIIRNRSEKTVGEISQGIIDRLEKLSNNHILDGLGDFLTEPQKDWARAKLRTETIFLLKARQASSPKAKNR